LLFFQYDDSWLSDYGDSDEFDKVIEEKSQASLKVHSYSTQNQPVIKTSTALMASIFMKPSHSSLGESFLSKKQPDEELSVWGQSGYQRGQSASTTNIIIDNENQSILNASTTDDSDKTMADMVKDAFSFTTLTTDENNSSDGNDHI